MSKRLADIEAEALRELQEEDKALLIAQAKERIRARRGRSLWARLFPYRIKLERIN